MIEDEEKKLLEWAVQVVRSYCANPVGIVTVQTRSFIPAVEMLRETVREHGAEFLGLEVCSHDTEKERDGIRANDVKVCCEKCAPAELERWNKDHLG